MVAKNSWMVSLRIINKEHRGHETALSAAPCCQQWLTAAQSVTADCSATDAPFYAYMLISFSVPLSKTKRAPSQSHNIKNIISSAINAGTASHSAILPEGSGYRSGSPRCKIELVQKLMVMRRGMLWRASSLISSAAAQSLITAPALQLSLPAAARCHIVGVLQACSQQFAASFCLSFLGRLTFQRVLTLLTLQGCSQQLPSDGLSKLVPSSLPWTMDRFPRQPLFPPDLATENLSFFPSGLLLKTPFVPPCWLFLFLVLFF